jgi:glycosyltransferase involved in cell wall biosynthesis
LKQTFSDWELVFVDNDLDESTAKVVEKYKKDSRFRYFRTGNLGMPDNWQFGLEQTTGKYVFVIEDKTFLKQDALEMLYQTMETDKPSFAVWRYDYFDNEKDIFYPAYIENKNIKWLESRDTLTYILNCDIVNYMPIAPRGFNVIVSKENIQKATKFHPEGKFFIPGAPDFTSGYQLLLTFDKYLLLPFSVATQAFRFLSLGEQSILKAKWTMDEVNLIASDDYFYKYVPIKCMRCWNCVINDFYRVAHWFGSEKEIKLNLVNYFIMNWHEIMFALSHGTNMAQEINVYFKALDAIEDEKTSQKIREIMKETKEFASNMRNMQITTELSSKITPLQKIPREIKRVFRQMFEKKCSKIQKFHNFEEFINQY